MRVFVLNGPNLDLLGTREPDIYGSRTLADLEEVCRKRGAELGLEVEFRQTNDEGRMIEWLQEAGRESAGVVLNPGAWTHYSLAVKKAAAAAEVPLVEVHLSNIYAREVFRAKSVLSDVAHAVIVGAGFQGYEFALEALAAKIEARE